MSLHQKDPVLFSLGSCPFL
uniref:Uncharacterized protein n=1 Tax=Arundo donax TaxID=35708 RepID=A0A0A9CIW9_ARUDO